MNKGGGRGEKDEAEDNNKESDQAGKTVEAPVDLLHVQGIGRLEWQQRLVLQHFLAWHTSLHIFNRGREKGQVS